MFEVFIYILIAIAVFFNTIDIIKKFIKNMRWWNR